MYQTSGPYTANKIIHFLQEHSTHQILTVSDVDEAKEDIKLADWSHEGWLLWIQAQKRILTLEKRNELLYHKVKELEYQLANMKVPQEDYTAATDRKLDEAYAQLQYLMQQLSNLPLSAVPPPPPPRKDRDGSATSTEFAGGHTFAAEERHVGDKPDRKMCRSEESGLKEEGRQLEEGSWSEEGRQAEEGRRLDEARYSEGRQIEEDRWFNDGVTDSRLHKSRSPRRKVVMADDAGLVLDVPVKEAEEGAEEDPDGSEEEESEQVHQATRIMADDAGIVLEQHHKDGRGNSGSVPKAVVENPTDDATQFGDTTNPSADNSNTPLDHKEYPLPLQEAPKEDTQMRQAAQEPLSGRLNSTPQDAPGSLAGDESSSNPEQADHSNSLNSTQTHRKGDMG